MTKKILATIPNLADKIILYSIWILVFFIPLTFFPDINPESLKLGIVYLIASIILFSWLLKALVLKKLVIRQNIFLPFVLLFILGLLLSLPFSNDLSTSFFGQYKRFHGGLLSYMAYSAIFFVVVNNFDIKKVKQTLVVTIVSAVFVSILGMVHYFVMDAPRAYATLQIPGSYASYIVIFFLISIGFMLESKDNLVKSLFLITTAILYLGFTFSYTRGTTLGLITGIILLTLITIYKIRHSKNKSSNFFKSNFRFLISLASIILLVNIFFGNALVNRPAIELPPDLEGDISVTATGVNRLIVWEGTINAIKQKPIFGFGLETFYSNFLEFRPVEMNYTTEWDAYFDRAHNEYLQFFATTGILGGASYLLLIGSLGVFTLRIIKKKDIDYIVLAIIGALVSYQIHLFFLFSVTTTATLFFLLLAFLIILSKEYKEIIINLNFLNSIKYKYLFSGLIIGLLILGIYYSTVFTLSELYVARSISAFRELELEKSYNFMKKANSINKFQPLYNTELAKNASIYAALTEDNKQRELLIKEVDTLNKKAVNNSTNNLFLLISAREAYFNLKRYLPGNQEYLNKAIQIQEDIVKKSPTFALEFYNLARFQFWANDLQSAEISTKKSLSLKTNYTESRISLARIFKEQGRIKELKEISKELGEDLPKDLK